MPSAGADCGRRLRCAQLDAVSQTWLADDCELSLAHSSPQAFVCACSHLVINRQSGGDQQMATAPIAVLEMPLIPPTGLSLTVNVPSPSALELLPFMFSAEVYPLTLLLLIINFAWLGLVVLSKTRGNVRFVNEQLSVANRFFQNRQPSMMHLPRMAHPRGRRRRSSPAYMIAYRVATVLPWWRRSWRAKTWVQLKQQHKVLRCFFVRFQLGENPDLFLTGAQKSTVLISIILLKMLGAAIFYRNSCDVACAFADGAVWLPRGECAERGGFCTRVQEFALPTSPSPLATLFSAERLVAGLLIALLALPATVFLDRVFWAQRHALNAYHAQQRGSMKQLEYAAAFREKIVEVDRLLSLDAMFRQWADAMRDMAEYAFRDKILALGTPPVQQIQYSVAPITAPADAESARISAVPAPSQLNSTADPGDELPAQLPTAPDDEAPRAARKDARNTTQSRDTTSHDSYHGSA